MQFSTITDERSFLKGMRHCREGRVPQTGSDKDYLRGYAYEVDRLDQREQHKTEQHK